MKRAEKIKLLYSIINKWYETENIEIEEYIDDEHGYIWHFQDKEIEIKRKLTISDVIAYNEENNWDSYLIDGVKFDDYWNLTDSPEYLLILWDNKRVSIEFQTEKCIDYIIEKIINEKIEKNLLK